MNKTINDFETALDTWDVVTDANGLVWALDENERARFWMPEDGGWGRIEAGHRPTPPFTESYADEATA